MIRAAVLLALSCAACVTEHHVAVEIQPQDVDATGTPIYPAGSAAFEVAIYASGRCPLDSADDADLCADEQPEVAAFLSAPPGPPAHQQWFALDEDGAPIGELPTGDYTWTVTLRRTDCAAVAFGCSLAPIGDESRTAVAVPLCTLGTAVAGCPAGTTCTAGECRE